MKLAVSRTDSYGRLRPQMMLYLAVKGLLHKRFRSILTILGVVIGVSSVFLLLSFGMGLQVLVQKQITQGEAINTIDVTSSNSKIISLTPVRVKQISSLPDVKAASGVHIAASKLTINDASTDIVAYGIDTFYIALDHSSMVVGRMINADNQTEAVLSSSLLSSIGVKDPRSLLGKELSVTIDVPSEKVPVEKKLKLVGVIDAGSGSELFVSRAIFGDAQPYSQVKVLATDRQAVANLRHAIESLGFDTTSPIDTLEQVDQVFRFFSIILAGLGSVGMLIAILGMLNTLTVSLLERTREIALMMTLGARSRDMLLLFVCESLLLSLIGGAIGIMVAIGISGVVDIALNYMAHARGVDESFTVFARPLWLIVLTQVFMLLVGLLVAVVPARRAARINPVDTLRQN